MGARYPPHEHYRGALEPAKARDPRHSHARFGQASLEIRFRVQLSPQHAALARAYVRPPFGFDFEAALTSRLKSSRCPGFSSGLESGTTSSPATWIAACGTYPDC